MKRILLLSALGFLGFTSCKKENSKPNSQFVTYAVTGKNLEVTVAPLMPRYFTFIAKDWNYRVQIVSGTTAYLEVKLSELGTPQKVQATILINGKVVNEINEMIGYNESKVITYKIP